MNWKDSVESIIFEPKIELSRKLELLVKLFDSLLKEQRDGILRKAEYHPSFSIDSLFALKEIMDYDNLIAPEPKKEKI